MHLLKLFFALSVCLGSHYGSSAPANSSLSLIYNDLSIIGRIINAIALQSEAIKKNLKARDVITELLKTHAVSFEKLIEYDPKKLLNELESVFDASSKVFENEKITKEQLERIQRYNDDLIKAVNIKLPDNPNNLMKKFMEDSFEGNLTLCDSEIVKVITNFYSVMNGDSIELSENNTRAVKNNLQRIKHCLTVITDFRKIMAPTDNVTDGLLQISKFKNKLLESARPESNERSRDFYQEINLLKRLAANSRKYWKTSNFSDTILGVASRLETISDHENEPKPNLCAGFPGEDDLAKVSEDVKSPWFKKEISKGKSTKDLEEALEPFGKFARKLGKLQKSWKRFDEKVGINEKFFNAFSERLSVNEKYENLDSGESFLRTAEHRHRETWKAGLQPYNVSEMAPIEKIGEQIQKIVQNVVGIQKWCGSILKNYDFITLQHVLDEVATLDLSFSDLEEHRKAFLNLAHFETFYSFSGEFQAFLAYQSDIKNNYIELRNDINLPTTVEKIVKFLKASPLNQKLRDTNYDKEMFQSIVTFHLNVLYFTRDDVRKEARSFFKVFEEMRNDFFKLEKFVKSLGSKNEDLLLKFRNSTKLSYTFGRGLRVFRDISRSYQLKKELLEANSYDPDVDKWISNMKDEHSHSGTFWNEPDRNQTIKKLVEDLEALDKTLKKFVSKDFETLREALSTAGNVTGLPDFEYGFRDVMEYLSKNHETFLNPDSIKFAINNSRKLADLDLDFSSHTGDLLAASLSFVNIREEFNTMFGLNPKHEKKTIKDAWLIVIIISICVFLLLVIGVLLIYGLTERGRNHYKNLYLFYFGKPEDFEKRWRYSLFMDRKNGKNALMDATREINALNVKKEAKRGAYINVFTEFGNTPLHLSTKQGYPEIVEVLIKNGADRSLLNYQNRTPEQMIPENYRETQPEKVEKYQKIAAIYNKYRNKKFRKRVPEVFPSSSFHIYVEEKTDTELSNDFMEQFKSIASPTLIAATTHVIVKTDSDGVLEIDGFEYLTWIMNGVIIVKESWMTDCLKNPKLIEKDSEYLVEKVRYKDTVYETVLAWSKAMAKGEMPYLFGVYVCLVMKEQKNVFHITSIVNAQGGTMCKDFLEKQNYNIGSHPYLHAHLGPLFLITDGSTDLTLYKNDPDKMYTVFTEDEFVHFLLKREINRDARPNPIIVSKEDDN